ncbi:MAG: glycosyltransferase family 2 protein [Bernardetiaceae bacterium]
MDARAQHTYILLPAYQAARTLGPTLEAIPEGWTQNLVLCDDASTDETFTLAQRYGIPHVLRHPYNKGYGANQKTLYDFALSRSDAHFLVLLHPDFQYDPSLIPTLVAALDAADLVLATRIHDALQGGMPLYKYCANRLLTAIQNRAFGLDLEEYHSGYRAFRREVLCRISYQNNSDDFIFDNQVLVQSIQAGFRIGQIRCPTRYLPDSSSINFLRSCHYGWGVLKETFRYLS